MTEFEKFSRIQEIVSAAVPLKIRWDSRRKDKYPSGYYFYDPQRIHIYSTAERNNEQNISMVASMILHEYAHYIFDIVETELEFSNDHEFEYHIWKIAEYLVSPKLLPRTFYSFANFCLGTYYE
jgi:hypothetical protein